MNKKKIYITLCLLISTVFMMSGCAKKETMYYWDDYQTNLYNYYQVDKNSWQEQLASLELIIEKSQAENKPVPPGLHAHLGLLYANTGAKDKALEQFAIEKSRYPESSHFIDFIQNTYQGKINEK